ncbi:MAG: hypothetical protein LC667_01720, partial [Thioalkalivibrio sp.]|nr:hypothetical protein [Thioalkalivibrio sp.]
LAGVGVVVLDEFQLIADPERGRAVELMACRLRKLRLQTGLPQLVALCGEVGDFNGLDAWIGGSLVGPVPRPIPLDEAVVRSDGSLCVKRGGTGVVENLPLFSPRFKSGVTPQRADLARASIAVGVARALANEGQICLLFCTSKPQVIRVAEMLCAALSLPPITALVHMLDQKPSRDRHRASRKLHETAASGIAFHIADLESDEREAVETLLRSGHIRILVATTTLAQGINTPVDSVVFVDNAFFQGKDQPPRALSLIEYRNMAGRAGRTVPGGPPKGTSFLVAESDIAATELLARYIEPSSQPLQSSLSHMDLDDLLVVLLTLRGVAGVIDLTSEAAETLWGYQSKTIPNWDVGLRRALDSRLRDLLADGFVSTATGPKVELAPLGRVVAQSALRVASARRVRDGAIQIAQAGEQLDATALLVLTLTTIELDSMYVPSTAHADVGSFHPSQEGILSGRTATYHVLSDPAHIQSDPNELIKGRMQRLAGTVAWLGGRPVADVEDAFTSGQIPALATLRTIAERISHLITAVAAIVAITYPGSAEAMQALVPVLRARLEIGGTAAAARLYRLRLGLSRAQCFALIDLGITDATSLAAALVSQRDAVEVVLSTPGLASLDARIASRTARSRTRSEPSAEVLDLFSRQDL